MEKVLYIEMDYDELDKLISDAYGINYEFVAFEEAHNDSSHTFLVEAESLDEYNQSKLNGKDFHFMARSLLCDLCHQGKIEAGNYLINVCW